MKKIKLKSRKEKDGYIRKKFLSYTMNITTNDELKNFQYLKQVASLSKYSLKVFLLIAGQKYAKHLNFLKLRKI